MTKLWFGLVLIIIGILIIINMSDIAADWAGYGGDGMVQSVILAALGGFSTIVGLILFLPSFIPWVFRKVSRKWLLKGEVAWFCDECDAKVAETDKLCPKCGVELE